MANEKKEPQVIVTSIGVEHGKSVVRIMIDGSRREIATDLKSFAMLAAAGVKVSNVG